MTYNRDIYCYANRGVVNFEREYWPLPPGINDAPIFLHGRPNFKKKNEETKFSGQNLPPPPKKNVRTYSKILQMTKRLMLWTRNS